MREYREVRKELSGDAEAAAPYIGMARKLLGALKIQMQFGKLQHLSRDYDLPDGTTISVLSSHGQDTVRIYAPPEVPETPPREIPVPVEPIPVVWPEFEQPTYLLSDELYMESGVIDLIGIGTESPLLDIDGVIHLGTETKLYPRYNGGINVSAAIGAGGEVQDKHTSRAFGALGDSRLIDQVGPKKLAAVLVPASMFTGKMRLHVQALYGQKLAEWQYSRDIGDFGTVPGHLLHEPTQVMYTMNTGIYTDENFGYWLVSLDGGCAVRGMVLSPAGAKLRDYVRAHAKRMDPKILDKLEAYMLSTARPSATMTFPVPVEVPASSSMGYGWKFNWDGTVADIVVNEFFSPDGNVSYNISSHYRIVLVRDGAKKDTTDTRAMNPTEKLAHNIAFEKSRWTAKNTRLEGPVTWKNSFVYSAIASPDWFGQGLSKLGSKFGNLGGAGAPFYCFYIRNELKVFRFDFVLGTMQERRESSPSYYGGNNPTGAYTYFTLGAEGGYSEHAATYPTWRFTFHCEGYSVTATLDSHVADYRKRSQVSFDPGSADYFAGEFVNVSTFHIDTGNPGTIATGAYGQCGSFADASGYAQYNVPQFTTHYLMNYLAISWSDESGTKTYAPRVYVMTVIPSYDAEAALMHQHKLDVVTTTGSGNRYDVGNYGGSGSGKWIGGSKIDSGGLITWFGLDDGSGVGVGGVSLVTTAITIDTIDYTTSGLQDGVVATGAKAGPGSTGFSALLEPTFGQLFDGAREDVSSQWYAVGSVGGVMYGPTFHITGGYDKPLFAVKPAAFVGWA